MTDLLALAEKLSVASANKQYELFLEAAELVWPDQRYWKRKLRFIRLCDLSAFVEAALMLVPDEHASGLELYPDGEMSYANVWHDTPEYDGMAINEVRAFRAGPAIAASALKARARSNSISQGSDDRG